MEAKVVKPSIPAWVPLTVAVACFAAIAYVLFGAGGRDDAYITYWPAYTLATQGKIVNYNGEALEQSSSLLHVLLLGAVSYIAQLRPDQVGWALIFVCGIAAVVVTALVARRVVPNAWGWVLTCIVLSPPFLYWSVSELEGPLVALTLLLVFVGWSAFLRDGKPLALLTAIPYVLARSEAFVVLAIAALIILALPPMRKRAITLLVSAIVFGGALALYRLNWTGYAAPLPAYVKGGFTPLNLLIGVQSLALYLPLLALSVYGLARLAKVHPVMFALTSSALLFILAAGGDFMEGYRFLVPIAPFLAFGIAALPFTARAVGVAGQVAMLIYIAQTQSTGTPLWNRGAIDPRAEWTVTVCRDHLRDLQFSEDLNHTIADLLKSRPTVTVLSIRAGFTFYRAKVAFGDRVQTIDMVGLSDDVIHKHGLTWEQKRPGTRPAWIQKTIESASRMEKPLLDQFEIIRVKHAMFKRYAVFDDVVNGLPAPPDIIFNVVNDNVKAGYLKQIDQLGYELTVFDSHDLRNAGPLPGQPITSGQALAVRRSELSSSKNRGAYKTASFEQHHQQP